MARSLIAIDADPSQIRSAQRKELVDLELGDVLGEDSFAEIFGVDTADGDWHGDSPRLRRSGSMPGILLWAPWAIPFSTRCPVLCRAAQTAFC
jgi:hypothetical protein